MFSKYISVSIFYLICLLFYIKNIKGYGSGDGDLKLIIDHDGGADDAFAIFMALLYEKYFGGPRVVALTTSHGNVNESQAFENTQRILNLADRRDIPIYRGSGKSLIKNYPSDGFFGKDGLGDNGYGGPFKQIPAQTNHASLAILEMSKEYKGQLVVVSLGALTNIALAIRLDPDFAGRLSHLYIAGGNLRNDTRLNPEFNAKIDTEAYFIAVQSTPIDSTTLIPLSQTQKDITKKWRREVFGSIDTKIVKALNAFEEISLANISKGTFWGLLDAAAMAIVLNKNLINETAYCDHTIILCGEHRGKNINSFVTKDKANIHTLVSMCSDEYKNFLIDVFSTKK